jgi:hypothetical protein
LYQTIATHNQLLLLLAQEFRDYQQDCICIAKVLLSKLLKLNRVGGRIKTDIVDGFRLDQGWFYPSYPEAKMLLDALQLKTFADGFIRWWSVRNC